MSIVTVAIVVSPCSIDAPLNVFATVGIGACVTDSACAATGAVGKFADVMSKLAFVNVPNPIARTSTDTEHVAPSDTVPPLRAKLPAPAAAVTWRA